MEVNTLYGGKHTVTNPTHHSYDLERDRVRFEAGAETDRAASDVVHSRLPHLQVYLLGTGQVTHRSDQGQCRGSRRDNSV